jgi:hypothetical protein
MHRPAPDPLPCRHLPVPLSSPPAWPQAGPLFAPALPLHAMARHPLAARLRLWYIATWLRTVLPTCRRLGPGVCRGPPPGSHPAHSDPTPRGSQAGLRSGRARGRVFLRARARALARASATGTAPRAAAWPAVLGYRSARRGRGVSHASQRAARRSRLANVHAAHCQKPASTSMSESPATAAPPARRGRAHGETALYSDPRGSCRIRVPCRNRVLTRLHRRAAVPAVLGINGACAAL